MSRSRFPALDAAAYLRLPTEEDALCFWLGDKRRLGFAQLHGGIGRHVRDGRGQNVAGLGDVLIWLHRADGTVLRVVLEIKIGRDALSAVQRDVLDWEAGSGALVLVVRYGTPRPGEVTQDEAVRAIERMLRA